MSEGNKIAAAILACEASRQQQEFGEGRAGQGAGGQRRRRRAMVIFRRLSRAARSSPYPHGLILR